MTKTNRMVKDYTGSLIPRSKAHKINDVYYEEGTSCFLMPDGQWYRINSPKIALDHYTGSYVLKSHSKDLIEGLVGANGEIGFFSNNDFSVSVRDDRIGGTRGALNEEIALANGYIESVNNGVFYKLTSITDKDRKEWFDVMSIPANERSTDYNLESNPDKKLQLQNTYKNLKIPISKEAKAIGNLLGDKTFGCEWEIINGFLPKRIRYKYGIKALKDGSLRDQNGRDKEGMELVTVPMDGAKGIQVLFNVMDELTRRCEVNNLCALHYHFGNVRKDKLFVLSFYKLITLIQKELHYYFPYSRFNSIRADGKIYCKFLESLDIDYDHILKAKDEETFRTLTSREFNKIYSWLNRGHGLGERYGEKTIVRDVVFVDGKKMFSEKWFSNIYTTKSTHHALQGNQKWDKTYVLSLSN